ncbi:MAG: hypothetical protein ACYS99_01990 [Planctomycetota bacterium]
MSVAPKPNLTLLASPLAYGGYEQPVVRFTVGSVPRVNDVEVVLRRATTWGAIDLRVATTSGRPPGQVLLSLKNQVGCWAPGFWMRKIELDGEGRARIEAVLPGRYRASIRRAEADVEVTANSTTSLDLTLPD